MTSWILITSKDGCLTIFMGPCLITIIVMKTFEAEFPIVLACSCCFSPFHHALLSRCSHSTHSQACLHLPTMKLKTAVKSPLLIYFPSMSQPSASCFPLYIPCHNNDCHRDPLLNSQLYMRVCTAPRSPYLGTAHYEWCHQCPAVGQDHLVLSAGHSSSYSQKDSAVISALYILEIPEKYEMNCLKKWQKPGNSRFFFSLAFIALPLIFKKCIKLFFLRKNYSNLVLIWTLEAFFFTFRATSWRSQIAEFCSHLYWNKMEVLKTQN